MGLQVKKSYCLGIGSILVVFIIWYRKSANPLIGLDPTNPELIKTVRDEFLRAPSGLPYALSQPDVVDVSVGQAQMVLKILQNKTGGTFVECGALDGETRSNTLYMERWLGWRGLLVEPDPDSFRMLLQKHRRAWAIQACLSGSKVSQVSFKQDFNMGMIDDGSPARRSGKPSYANVLCIPLEAMLRALEWKTVDYFSLDVEGHEYSVLSQLPFERLDIRTLSVEFRHVPEGKEAIRTLMESKGYEVNSEITHFDDLANDFIFQKKELK
ncbi:uncharacterized protein LOC119098518 [Pollicipes pollicipes]|uniref:uncharacterized protein LOC119098518 n=1 Tax=Pollicipes pollicipes TaxID=41117 RepID=UPI001884E38C|nr:uncharacterized protein LOC119098518 [Pollicipes pollicipes]XP_037077369.1 uncharacterized protein LOC119098518 [Pollicipes pollicipes]